MHKSIIEYGSPKDGTTIKMGFHTAVVDELPEDTDVFLVLSRKPSVPELIATKTYIYVIDQDGRINYIMPAEKYFKQQKP